MCFVTSALIVYRLFVENPVERPYVRFVALLLFRRF